MSGILGAAGAGAAPKQDPGDAEMTVLAEQHALLVTGPIGERFEPRLRSLLAANPGTRLVIMRGPGGMRGQALRAAQLFNDRRVTVRVAGKCASACALLWAAARSREMTDDSRIGLHGSTLPGAEAMPELLRQQIIARNDRETDDVLRAAGFPEPVIAKGAATPPSSMSWFAATELEAGGVPFVMHAAHVDDEAMPRIADVPATPAAGARVASATDAAVSASLAEADRMRGESRSPSVGRRIIGWFGCRMAGRCERSDGAAAGRGTGTR